MTFFESYSKFFSFSFVMRFKNSLSKEAENQMKYRKVNMAQSFKYFITQILHY